MKTFIILTLCSIFITGCVSQPKKAKPPKSTKTLVCGVDIMEALETLNADGKMESFEIDGRRQRFNVKMKQ